MSESAPGREARTHLTESVAEAEAADELAAREAEEHRSDPTISMDELVADLFET